MISELEVSKLFAESSYLKSLIFFRLVTSGIALACMSVLELNRKKFIAHKSLKMLLNLHGFWTFLLCLSTFVESIQQAVAHLTFEHPSDLLMTSNQCFLRMIPMFFGVCGSVSSLLAMSAERWEASKNISTYESSSGSSGLKFVAFHLLLTFVGVFMDSCMYGFPTRVAHCPIVSVAGRPIQTVLVTGLFYSELYTIYVYTKLLKRNVNIHASVDSMDMPLTERYQLIENIRVLRVLLPIVISHTSVTMAGAAAFFYFELAGFQAELYPIFEDTINMVYLQGIIMPLIFLLRFRKKRLMEHRIIITNTRIGDDLIAAYDREITKGW